MYTLVTNAVYTLHKRPMSSDVKLDVFVNGKLCKDPKLAQANDFVFAGLDKPGNTANPVGLKHDTSKGRRVRLIQFQQNVSYKNAMAIAALSSQNPRVITILLMRFSDHNRPSPVIC
ncbi:hypothetical protein AMTR_s00072p00162520 [Amborella trichopoda]|uniref:Uncharacterized protein n=1 Tax=Amborella trichopoda TaxID=13333 RepID=W1NPC2_AMBTC|nr:hypothetical protein AMTR_s00072p00162520 [Amborella trichopoda]